jgi:hypothetical protein
VVRSRACTHCLAACWCSNVCFTIFRPRFGCCCCIIVLSAVRLSHVASVPTVHRLCCHCSGCDSMLCYAGVSLRAWHVSTTSPHLCFLAGPCTTWTIPFTTLSCIHLAARLVTCVSMPCTRCRNVTACSDTAPSPLALSARGHLQMVVTVCLHAWQVQPPLVVCCI